MWLECVAEWRMRKDKRCTLPDPETVRRRDAFLEEIDKTILVTDTPEETLVEALNDVE